MSSWGYGSYKPSYLHNVGSQPLCALTIGQAIDVAAEKYGEEEAFVSIYQGHRFTYNQVRDKADRLAAGLMQLGLKTGDRLGIWGPNSSEWYISRLAAARGGFIAVQIDPAYQAPQLLQSLNKVDIKMLIFSEFYKSNNCYQIVRTCIPELEQYPEEGTELNSSQVPSLKRIIIMTDKQYKGTHRIKDLIEAALPESLQKIRDLQTTIQPDDGCAIQFSSGTTGSPKGALLSHHNLVNNAIVYEKLLKLRMKNSKILVATQFCHTSGSLGGIICGIITNSVCVIPYPTFDAVQMLEGIIKEECTTMLATPSLFVDMIAKSKQHGLIVTTLKTTAVGGAPCSRQLSQEIKETLNIDQLVSCYGMTEVSFVTGCTPDASLEQRLSTVGYTAEHLEVKVVDKEGRMVPIGTPGELWVRGYNVLLRYWKDEEKTREFIGEDGWAKTGDLFVLQEDGYLRIVGRVKDMIIRIADNIFPAEIEDFLTQHPDIMEAQAFGVPDPKVGEEIGVYLRLREGATLTEETVKHYCKDKVAEYRIPRYIRFIKEFERTAIGKVQKFKLLQQLKKELGIE